MSDSRPVLRQPGLRAVRPRAPPTPSSQALSARRAAEKLSILVARALVRLVPRKRTGEGRSSRMMRRFRLLILLSLLALSATGVLAHPAAAIEPTRVPIDQTVTFEVQDICSFPVTITATIVGTETTFYDQSGEITRQQIHVVEQDVFTANGESLTGLPFTFNIQVLFEDGEVTHVYASGLVERVPLPDGTVFLSAGRLDFAAHPGSDFRIVPDVGRSGDVAAFCAALAG
jgi:hypothetical protein